MEENVFWLRLWQSLFIAVMVVALGIGGCTMHQNSKVMKAIESGVSPERARIAFSSQVTESEKIAAILTKECDE